MRRTVPGVIWVSAALVAMSVLVTDRLDAATPRKRRSDAPPVKADETVGELAFVVQNGEIRVEGVGLVSNLENTGADPPPSPYRTQLVDEMSKAGVEHASKLLTQPQFSMVIVRMTIPTGATPKDRFDIEVEVPPACGTKSLAGGYLMPTRLREAMVAGGQYRGGQEIAIAQGPIMLGTAKKADDKKAGRVLGGGRVKKDFPFNLVIKEKRKSIHTSAILEKVVNERFHQSEAGQQKGVATAKTDGFLVVKVPPIYQQNKDRYFRVLQLLPMADSPELRARRTQTWSKQLLDPMTSGVAALKLEGLGITAIEALQAGLKADDPDVRFFAAEALAYLEDSSGAEALGQAAVTKPAYRAYALAALAANQQVASHGQLRKLMDAPDIEVRYGAFNALRTLDPFDPSLGQVRVLEEPKRDEEEDEASDSMAVALASASRRSAREADPFSLYLVETDGPPVVHVSRTRRSEVVVFGRGQKLLPPIVLGSGAVLLNAADKDDQVEVSKIVPTKFGDGDTKFRCSLDLGDVIRRVANLGASYPEVVAILEAAHRQKNLPGVLVVDAVPASNVDYVAAAILGKKKAKSDRDLKKASSQSGGSRLRRLFGFRDSSSARPSGESSDESPPASGASPTAKSDVVASRESQSSIPSQSSTPGSKDAGIPSGTTTTTDSKVKKDDAIQRTGGESEVPAPRIRLLDRFRRGSS